VSHKLAFHPKHFSHFYAPLENVTTSKQRLSEELWMGVVVMSECANNSDHNK